MGDTTSLFVINKIYWERIFLNIEIATSYQGDVQFYLVRSDGKKVAVESVREDNVCRISINIACVKDRKFLDNGRWRVWAIIEDEEQVCDIIIDEAYKLDDLSRIFKYDKNQMAYNISFGVDPESEERLQLYIDSYFMIENRHWKKRRYCKEGKGYKDKFNRTLMFGNIILMRAYYHVLYALIPKRGNRVMLMSETKGILWGNLKYIDDKIKERHLDEKFKLTYSLRCAVGSHQRIFSWIKLVTKMAAQDFIFIDDYAPVLGFFNLGRKTKLIQVWHAGEGFKSVGYSRFGKDGSPFPQGSCHKKYTHVITGSEHLVKVFQEVFAIEAEAFYPVGMPRLDGFLDGNNIQEFKKQFYRQYPQLKNKKVILFAPTYRGFGQKSAYYDYEKIDLNRIYEYCERQGYVFIVKMHPFVKEPIEIPDEYKDLVFDFSEYPNINDLYYVTDILITDYSSNYFEYALMQRPVIFYTYDRNVYEITRGVHRSVKENAPGKVCDTFDELMECLWKEDFEIEKIERFVEDNFGDYQGNAADRVIDEILLKEKAE